MGRRWMGEAERADMTPKGGFSGAAGAAAASRGRSNEGTMENFILVV